MQFARAGALVGAAVAAIAATVFAAVPASAHTPDLVAKCVDGKTSLSVKLTAYAESTSQKTNHVKVVLDGTEELENKDFGRSFEGSYSTSGDVKREFVVEVTAHDDSRFSFKKTETVEACIASTPDFPTPTGTTTTLPPVPSDTPTVSEPAPSSTTTTTTTATTTTTEVAVVPAGDTTALANTGASIAIPLVIGVVLLGGGAALLIVLRRRAANN